MTPAVARRRILLRAGAALAGVVLAVSVVAAAAPAAAREGRPTIVSLTFDDSNANQMAAVDIMNANGLDGTFYTLTGFIGEVGHQTRANLDAIAEAGHEIAGHTVVHADMATLNAHEATAEACQSRETLTSWGFPVTSFAYPFASMNATAKAAVRACGYNTARLLDTLETRFGCFGCGFAERIPPVDPFEMRAPDQVDATWTLADLQNTVINAENTTGGWVGFTFHHVCDDCDVDGLSISTALFRSFAEWLAARPRTHDTSVKTVHEAIGGGVKPLVAVQRPPAPEPRINGIVNPSLEQAGPSGVPQCWSTAGFGTNSPTFSTVSPGRTGAVTERLVMSEYVDGDAKLVVPMDFGTCTPSVTPGRRYSLRAWYTATTMTQFAVYLRNPTGAWEYWTSSSWFAATATYTQAVWNSDPIPEGHTGISFGLNLFENGTLRTDDYALYDLAGAPGAIVPAVPAITGAQRVGSSLVANPAAWSPPEVKLTYRWLRDGIAISGATGSRYRLTNADRGHTLRVVVDGTLAGYAPATATSAPTPTIQQHPANVLCLAVGTAFDDPLIGAALAGQQGGSLFVTPSACLSPLADADVRRVRSADVMPPAESGG